MYSGRARDSTVFGLSAILAQQKQQQTANTLLFVQLMEFLSLLSQTVIVLVCVMLDSYDDAVVVYIKL